MGGQSCVVLKIPTSELVSSHFVNKPSFKAPSLSLQVRGYNSDTMIGFMHPANLKKRAIESS
jgi:hypothetical protein